MAIINADAALTQAYNDVEANMGNMDFNYIANRQPEAEMAPNVAGNYQIHYGHRDEQNPPYNAANRFVPAILHEMMHISAGLQFHTYTPAPGVGHVANMNLPVPVGVVAPEDEDFGLTDNQFTDLVLGAQVQIGNMDLNWGNLGDEAQLDYNTETITDVQRTFIDGRITYARVLPGMLAHYDTVLFDLLYYLRSEGAEASRSYAYAHNMLVDANERRGAAVGAVPVIARAPVPVAPLAPLPAPPALSFWQRLITWLFGLCGRLCASQTMD